MSSITEMINTEFSNAPVATFIALLTFVGAAFKLIIKIKNTLLKTEEENTRTLTLAGIPPFWLRFFLISLSTRKTPEVKKLDKAMGYIAFSLFLGSFLFTGPILVRTVKTPENHTLLIWKATGELFYISDAKAQESTLFSPPAWQIKKSDCPASDAPALSQHASPSPEVAKGICDLFITQEGREYLTRSIKTYPKGKRFVYVMLPFTELVLLWMAAGCALHLYYSAKLRKYILDEQEKALSYVR
ncbi:DUF6216 family protein [Franconibacter sp. IITDAS19]|uniref:DUF6216 family protein n=1 Tax=Franconibacter sp. IITDAS19 TaxID=2930569 RepID=UPI001FFC2805|nr:DUF6216 family protein [Franconibacter sp. IITDAS19]MCK1967408.1 DUF6216 family protein [Franconibacter sp. IITDAS19]